MTKLLFPTGSNPDQASLSQAEALALLKCSDLMDADWYRRTYRDVGQTGLAAEVHYLKHGARMGRNPSPYFDTEAYFASHPKLRAEGINPLVHCIYSGNKEGSPPSSQAVRTQIGAIRARLYGLGLELSALAELRGLIAEAENNAIMAEAARDIALWHLHRGRSRTDFTAALMAIDTARRARPEMQILTDLSTIEQVALHNFEDAETATKRFVAAARAGEITNDTALARVNFQPDPALRLAIINGVLAHNEISSLALLPDMHLEPYDRLTSSGPLPLVLGGPMVTVLLAVYNGARTIGTALRSLLEQTWKNLEILVIDDHSTDDTPTVVAEFAARDRRVRMIRMPANGGAYQARNLGLDHAAGDYVTIHDADDWSHPKKIETQARFLQANLDVLGCTSEQARATDDLRFPKLRGTGRYIVFNTSSFIRHSPSGVLTDV